MKNIRLTTSEWSALREQIRAGNKIAAIKVARDAVRHRSPAEPSSLSNQSWRAGVGLKEAKEAVEFHMHSIGLINADGTPCWIEGRQPEGRLSPDQPIKRIVIDMGDGEVEVNMEEMSLRFLSTLTHMKLTDVQRLVDLWQRVKDWEESA